MVECFPEQLRRCAIEYACHGKKHDVFQTVLTTYIVIIVIYKDLMFTQNEQKCLNDFMIFLVHEVTAEGAYIVNNFHEHYICLNK